VRILGQQAACYSPLIRYQYHEEASVIQAAYRTGSTGDELQPIGIGDVRALGRFDVQGPVAIHESGPMVDAHDSGNISRSTISQIV
jgi:hypothetical protein